MSIGALAKASGASVRSIRHYEQHGLLTSIRADNGYRMFPAAAVAQVRQIQRLIATGFTVAEILSFPDCMRMIEGTPACSVTNDVQRRRLAAIEREIADLERRRGRLLAMLREGAGTPAE